MSRPKPGESGPYMTMAHAAELMGLSRRQANNRLCSLHRAHPNAGVLHRNQGTRQWDVSPRGLRLAMSGELDESVQELRQEVAFIKSDLRSIQYRIGRVEESQIEHVSCLTVKKNG